MTPSVVEEGLRFVVNLNPIVRLCGIALLAQIPDPHQEADYQSNVSFRQGCEASLCKIEAVAEGRLCGDVISKQGVHVVADAIAQIVADSAHTFQPVD